MAAEPMDGSEQTVTIDAVVELLRNDKLRGYRIDIETDQMVEADENAEKERRIELATAMGGMINQAAPLIMSPVGPAVAPMVGEVLMFTLRGFKAGRQVEETFEKAVDTLVQALHQNPPQGEQQQADPHAEAKAKAELDRVKIEQAKVQVDKEEKDRRFGLDAERQKVELAKMANEDRRADSEMGLKQRAQDHAETSGEREHGLKERAQEHTEFTGDRDFSMKERAQKHTERAHKDNHTLAAAEKGVALASDEPDAKAQAAERETKRDEALDEILTMLKAPRRIIKEGGKATHIEINGVRLPVRRDDDGSLSIG